MPRNPRPIKTPGGLQAGLSLARICMAGQAEISLAPGDVAGIAAPQVLVTTDHPVAACMAAQYAGWQISVGKYFAMGSGPMRAAYGKEELFQHIPGKEQTPVAVGVLVGSGSGPSSVRSSTQRMPAVLGPAPSCTRTCVIPAPALMLR